MIDPNEYDDIIVTVAHPWSDLPMPLSHWIATGPPAQRPLVAITAAKRKSTGEPVPMTEIPLEFHNSPKCHRMQRRGLLPMPFGPPPDEDPWYFDEKFYRDAPESVRRIIDEEKGDV